VARGGGTQPPAKPDGLSEETWNRWLQLKPFEKPRVFRQLIRGGQPAPGPSPGG
jgi:hypothetical protein